MPTVSGLYVYPIKSLGGIALQKSALSEHGLQHDRRWMIVDEQGMFISQRTHPSLALLQTSIEADSINLYHKHTHGGIQVPFLPTTDTIKTVTIWDDVCEAVVVGQTIDEWLCDYLNETVHLVYMPDSTQRLVDKRYTTANTFTHFSDGYPFLLIGEASLQELNNKAGLLFGMDRFRPNIVVANTLPQEEEEWHETLIGAGLYTGVKPCTRCNLTTIDQASGQSGKEPLKTLATYKRTGKRIIFGQNMVYNGGAQTIAVGDEVTVKSRKKIQFVS